MCPFWAPGARFGREWRPFILLKRRLSGCVVTGAAFLGTKWGMTIEEHTVAGRDPAEICDHETSGIDRGMLAGAALVVAACVAYFPSQQERAFGVVPWTSPTYSDLTFEAGRITRGHLWDEIKSATLHVSITIPEELPAWEVEQNLRHAMLRAYQDCSSRSSIFSGLWPSVGGGLQDQTEYRCAHMPIEYVDIKAVGALSRAVLARGDFRSGVRWGRRQNKMAEDKSLFDVTRWQMTLSIVDLDGAVCVPDP